MISDPLPAPPRTKLAMHEDSQLAPNSRRRRGAIAVCVLLGHALGLYMAVHQSAEVLRIEAGRPPGGSVQVRLVAAPAPAQTVPPKRATELPKPVVKQKAEKAPPLLSSRSASRRNVEEMKAPDVAATQPQAQRPTPMATPAPVAPAAPVAPVATTATAPNLLDAPKQISAGELAQLGCQIPRPEYPAKARRLQQEGTVLVHLTIGNDGAVTAARVAQSSGSQYLDEAALGAIRAGRCHPYEKAGITRSVEANQPIAFNLND
jgi:periplasmic protein TonB